MYPGRYSGYAPVSTPQQQNNNTALHSSSASSSSTSRPPSAAFPLRPPSSSSRPLSSSASAAWNSKSRNHPQHQQHYQHNSALTAATMGTVLFPPSRPGSMQQGRPHHQRRPPTSTSTVATSADLDGLFCPHDFNSATMSSVSNNNMSIRQRPPLFTRNSSTREVADALKVLPTKTLIEAVISVLLDEDDSGNSGSEPRSLLRAPITMLDEEYRRQLSRQALKRFRKGGFLPTSSSASASAGACFVNNKDDDDGDDDGNGGGPSWSNSNAGIVDGVTAAAMCGRNNGERELLQDALPAISSRRAEKGSNNNNNNNNNNNSKEATLLDSEWQELHAQLVTATNENLKSRDRILQLQRRCTELQTALHVAERAAAAGHRRNIEAENEARARNDDDGSNNNKNYHVSETALNSDSIAGGEEEDPKIVELNRLELEQALLAQQKIASHHHHHHHHNRQLSGDQTNNNRRAGGGGGVLDGGSPEQQRAIANSNLLVENAALKNLVSQLRARCEELERAMGIGDFFVCETTLQNKMSSIVRDNEYLISVSTSLAQELLERMGCGGGGSASAGEFGDV